LALGAVEADIRAELEKDGFKFVAKSDTEILPHLYEEYGDEMMQHLNGMFAFALWDSKRRRLLIARDRFGEKPLYWGVFDKTLLFASEPKVLLANPSVRPGLNLQALRQYLSFDYVPEPLSIYEGINKLPAAHTLTLDDGEIKVERYWKLSTQPSILNGTPFKALVWRLLGVRIGNLLLAIHDLAQLFTRGIAQVLILDVREKHVGRKIDDCE
jgi:asparagine synthetase B (glutamine-hydrolysing)